MSGIFLLLCGAMFGWILYAIFGGPPDDPPPPLSSADKAASVQDATCHCIDCLRETHCVERECSQ